TTAKFVTNPYKVEEKIYRSGDLARMLSNGDMEYLGRIDHQVKIRGFRIELGEVESNLLKIERVKEVVVLDKEEEEGSKYLCAYYVGEKEYSVGELREELKKSLPDYMIPLYFIKLENMPLTPNGKIDRKALPEPEGKVNTGAEYEAPRNELEEKLVEIWEEVLGVSNVGISDNFFELGGHSIKLVNLAVKISKKLAVNITVEELFTNPTIKEIYNILYLSLSKEEKFITRLSYNGDKNIFAFPPIIGYGYTYLSLAKLTNTHSIYAFNFIDNINMIDEYIKVITNIQNSGPFILLGYSVGGSLAFEVAKVLENKGYEVSNIIMIDSNVMGLVKSSLSDSLRYEIVNNVKSFFNVNGFYGFQASIEERVIRTYEKYSEYSNRNITEGKVNANIHIISSSNENGMNGKFDYLLKWTDHTLKEIIIYNGYGTHKEMLSLGYCEKNVAIIKNILNEFN
ncbi:hypothetical protein KPL47_21770, partial [Clostridium estertheticum]|uniref:thioesterase domain-containing protein n=1 Tax=Clostridium estertheticum TaxID=238834 RepID=UPI00209AB91A